MPRRVYWVRRLLVVLLALALVYALAHLLGGANGAGPSGDASTSPVAAKPTTSGTGAPTTAATDRPTPTEPGTAGGAADGSVPLAVPTAPCADDDVLVAPEAPRTAYAGGAVRLRLSLSTRTSPACTWTASADSLVVRVTQGSERIWTTQQCRDAVPTRSLVLRQAEPTALTVVWGGQRSDADCSRAPDWADVGVYAVMAAAFGGDPLEVEVPLVRRPARTVTATPTPTPTDIPTGPGPTTGTPAGTPTGRGR